MTDLFKRGGHGFIKILSSSMSCGYFTAVSFQDTRTTNTRCNGDSQRRKKTDRKSVSSFLSFFFLFKRQKSRRSFIITIITIVLYHRRCTTHKHRQFTSIYLTLKAPYRYFRSLPTTVYSQMVSGVFVIL